tara:strand:+ start:225 stop:764 length:540 start_codon:yes stop_codon:yes gene_type:complete
MEDDDNNKYKYCKDINDKRIRVSIDNILDVWYWKECKTKQDYWYKINVYLYTNPKTGYQKYNLMINGKTCVLSRVIYKCYNNDWDITDSGKNNFVDHINNNSLDNRIVNLRILTNQQNQFNRNTRGTHFRKDWNPHNFWTAGITINGKRICKSGFETEEEAHQHYLILKQKYHIIPDNI